MNLKDLIYCSQVPSDSKEFQGRRKAAGSTKLEGVERSEEEERVINYQRDLSTNSRGGCIEKKASRSMKTNSKVRRERRVRCKRNVQRRSTT